MSAEDRKNACEKLPTEIGDYKITTRSGTVVAWFNPMTDHWVVNGREIGYGNIIRLPEKKNEEAIIAWEAVTE